MHQEEGVTHSVQMFGYYSNWDKQTAQTFDFNAAIIDMFGERVIDCTFRLAWTKELETDLGNDELLLLECEAALLDHNQDDRPDGQTERSLSMGDVIVFHKPPYPTRAFLCVASGFKEVDPLLILLE